MNEKPLTAADINREFSDITEMAEQGRVELTPEVSQYLHERMGKILDKHKQQGAVTENDMKFLN